MPDAEKSTSIGSRLVYASLGAAVTSLFVTPFDLFRIRMQSSKGGSLRAIVASIGVGQQLWTGLGPTLIATVPANAIYMVTYDRLKLQLNNNNNLDNNNVGLNGALAGLLARSVTVISMAPMELFRVRQQQTGNENVSVRQLFLRIKSEVAQQGLGVLWRGVGPQLWRDVPFSMIYWSLLEMLKLKLHCNKWWQITSHESKNEEWKVSFLAGAVSGSVASLVTHPFDLAKTRMQMEKRQDSHSISAADRKIYNLRSTLRLIVESDGWLGLYRGLLPRIAKVGPSCAIMIGIYEYGKQSS